MENIDAYEILTKQEAGVTQDTSVGWLEPKE